jgi:hypothetical protein
MAMCAGLCLMSKVCHAFVHDEPRSNCFITESYFKHAGERYSGPEPDAGAIYYLNRSNIAIL